MLSQKELAKKIGVSDSAICFWETGVNEPKVSYLNSLAEFFGVSSDFLLGREDEFGAASSAASTPSELSPEELTLIKKYRALNPANKKYLNQTIEILSDTPWEQKKFKRG